MNLFLDCIPCFIRQTLDVSRLLEQSEHDQKIILKKVIQRIANMDFDQSPPQIGQKVHQIIREHTNNPDPYLLLKDQSTNHALSLEANIRQKIKQAENPFETAVRFAIAGNIMDFGVKSKWDKEHIMASFHKAETHPIDTEKIQELYNELEYAQKILVLGDNAGETVFDKLLIEQFPGNAHIVYAVKGSPIINDATSIDALKAGLDSVAHIVPNGADIPGTSLANCSQEFLHKFKSADVIISKGQGNFETLNTTRANIFFLLQIKCEMLAKRYNYQLGDWIIDNFQKVDLCN